MGDEFLQRAYIDTADRSQVSHYDLRSEDGKSRTVCETLVMFFEISLCALTPCTDGHGKVLV